MPSNFGQYTGGIAPVQGISEAGARIGLMNQQGLNNFGQSLAEGIQTYNDNKSMNDFLDQKAQVLGQQIMQFHDMYAQNPEMKPFADSLMPYADTLAKTSSMSLAQKKGAITEVEHGFSNIGPQLQAFMQNKDMMLHQNLGTAANLYIGKTTMEVPAVVDKALNAYDFGKTPAQNQQDFASTLESMKAQGANIDIPDVLKRWADAAPTRLGQAKFDKFGKPINPDVQNAAIQQLKDQSALDTGSYTSDANYLEKEHALDESVSSDVVSQLNEQAKADKAAVTGFAPNFQEGLKKLSDAANAEKSMASKNASELALAGSDIAKSVLSSILKKVNDGETITPLDIKMALGSEEEARNPTTKPIESFPYYGSGMATPFIVGNQKAPSVRSPATNVVFNALSGMNDDAKLSSSQVLDLVNKVLPKVDQFKQSADAMAEKAKNIAAGAPIEQSKYQAQQVSMGEANVGSKSVESPYIDYDKMRRDTANFVAARMGYKDSSGNPVLPAGFDETFNKMHPEASLKVVQTSAGQMMWNGKEWVQTKLPQTIEQQRKANQGVFGIPTENGLAPAERVKGSGIALGGIFTGSDEELKEFKANEISTAQTIDAAKTLSDVIDTPFHSLLPTQKARAELAMATLASGLKNTLFSNSRYTEWEQEIIKKINVDPKEFLRLDSGDKVRLLNIVENNKKKLAMQAGQNGLTIRFSDSNPQAAVQSARNQRFGIGG